MSIHTSLRSGQTSGILRNVLKRYERVRVLVTKGEWVEGRSVFGLPKLRQIKVKVRKAESKEKEAAAPATETPGATPPAKSASARSPSSSRSP